MPLEILAFGFNAHGQLLPNQSAPNGIPTDIHTPTIIARAETSARVLYAGWSETILELDGSLHRRGSSGCGPITWFGSPPYRAYGDGLSCRIIFASDGREAWVPGQEGEGVRRFEEGVEGLAIAGNGRVVVIRGGVAYLYDSFTSFLSPSTPPPPPLPIPTPITALTATETSFTLLTSTHQLYTLGDARHPRLLCHTSSPSNTPTLLEALDGIPISSTTSCGFLCAALSSEADLYLWGGRAGDQEVIVELDGMEDDEVALVEQLEGVERVAVGMGHVLVLAEGRVWGAGRAGYGQLDLGSGSGVDMEGGDEEFVKEWREVQVKGKVRDVAAGGWSSFVVVEV